ncbi:hypothetical protein QZH41_005709 [Actinostola sp. cb2023]|nr:hypothetical protein QZH41_005709 [Actinostola sp. cb2023]
MSTKKLRARAYREAKKRCEDGTGGSGGDGEAINSEALNGEEPSGEAAGGEAAGGEASNGEAANNNNNNNDDLVISETLVCTICCDLRDLRGLVKMPWCRQSLHWHCQAEWRSVNPETEGGSVALCPICRRRVIPIPDYTLKKLTRNGVMEIERAGESKVVNVTTAALKESTTGLMKESDFFFCMASRMATSPR